MKHRHRITASNLRPVEGGASAADSRDCPPGTAGSRSHERKGAADVPLFTGRVQVPFWFLERPDQLDLFDGDATIWALATGDCPPTAERPYDRLTAWIALAFIGGIEHGGPVLDGSLDRDARLDLARIVLSEEEWLVVETIAVPKRYRQLTARRLESLIRHAPDYHDRLWAACWLVLVGWVRSRDCGFQEASARFPLGELEEAVIAAFADGQGVASPHDEVGMKRISATYEVNLALHRLAICEAHYELNGPPPYDCVKKTIGGHSGWRHVMRAVPAE